MKRSLLITSALIVSNFLAFAQNVNIPDANFKAYLVGNTAINTNADTEIQVSEATAFTGQISVDQFSGVTDLTGLEAFTNMTILQVVALNLSSINVSQNTGLTMLNVQSNNLTSIDVSQNTALVYLYLQYNQLSSIDVSSNVNLQGLLFTGNDLTTIDVSNNPNLVYLICENNNLTQLDVSNNPSLESLFCQSNDLSSLNMKNLSTSTLTSFNATSNPNLTCIEVDDVAAATANWTNIDAGASFATECCTITIPDANFKSYLVGNSAINTNGDGEIQCSEATAFTGIINCESQTIADLTGIEAFTAITGLYCGDNNLSTLDISNNGSLTQLYCGTNNLTSLDVSNNTSLTYLRLDVNNISTLDVSNNTALTYLRFNSNNISAIDLSNNVALTDLICYSNNLINLDLQYNVALTYLASAANNLDMLNMANGNNSNVVGFNVTNNPNLTCIKVDDVAFSTANWTNIDATASFNTVCTSVGLDETEPVQTVSVYPNPVQTELTISSEFEPLAIRVVDVFGKIVIANLSTNASLDVSGLMTGVYFLEVQTEKGTVSTKFIKE